MRPRTETDELLDVDTKVRAGLEVRAGQTIRARAVEIVAQSAKHTVVQVQAAKALLLYDGWEGMRAAAFELAPKVLVPS